eukprot:23233_5
MTVVASTIISPMMFFIAVQFLPFTRLSRHQPRKHGFLKLAAKAFHFLFKGLDLVFPLSCVTFCLLLQNLFPHLKSFYSLFNSPLNFSLHIHRQNTLLMFEALDKFVHASQKLMVIHGPDTFEIGRPREVRTTLSHRFCSSTLVTDG